MQWRKKGKKFAMNLEWYTWKYSWIGQLSIRRTRDKGQSTCRSAVELWFIPSVHSHPLSLGPHPVSASFMLGKKTSGIIVLPGKKKRLSYSFFPLLFFWKKKKPFFPCVLVKLKEIRSIRKFILSFLAY